MHRSAAELLLRQTALGVAGATCAGLLMACTTLTAATSPTPSAGDVGFLGGQVTIGPPRPVEQAGVPPPTPAPELCTSLVLIVASADGSWR